MTNGNSVVSKLQGKGYIVVPITVVATLVVGAWLNLSNQTAVAITVAKQHGAELELLRRDYTQLHGEMQVLLQSIDSHMDDRFRARDAAVMEERLNRRLDKLEARMDELTATRRP